MQKTKFAMRSLSALIILIAFTLSIGVIGCSTGVRGDLNRTVTLGGVEPTVSCSVSSGWLETMPGEETQELKSYSFQIEQKSSLPSLDLSYLSTDDDLGNGETNYRAMRDKALESGNYSNWSDLLAEKRIIDGAECTIHEYSYSHKNTGAVTSAIAYIHREGFYATVSYMDYTDNFESDAFYAVLDTLEIKG